MNNNYHKKKKKYLLRTPIISMCKQALTETFIKLG